MIMLLARRNDQNNWMTNFFNNFFDTDWTPRFVNATPAVNVKEDNHKYEMEMAAPGLKKEFCRVSVDEDGNLSIKIENKFEHKEAEPEKGEKHEHYLRQEFAYSNYEQTYALPENVDKKGIEAKVTDGVLTVTLPKIAPKEVAKLEQHIEVK